MQQSQYFNLEELLFIKSSIVSQVNKKKCSLFALCYLYFIKIGEKIGSNIAVPTILSIDILSAVESMENGGFVITSYNSSDGTDKQMFYVYDSSFQLICKRKTTYGFQRRLGLGTY